MSQTQSLGFVEDQSFHIKPLNSTHIRNIHNKLFRSDNANTSAVGNSCMNVLSLNKLNDNFVINQKFQQHLAEDSKNSDAVVISFLGNKKVGKSFLVDSLLTYEIGKVCRTMSKNTSKIVNTPIIQRQNNTNQNKIIYFDCSGNTTNQIFLWNYFVSSVIVYSISAANLVNQQRTLIENLVYLQSHLDIDNQVLSLPQLIIVRRDCEIQYTNRDLVRQVENLGVFQHGIITISLPYPGAAGVTQKQLLDVPLKQINHQFTKNIENLHKMLKCSKPKIIKGNYLTTKILSLTLEPAANSINKQHKISTNKVWNQLVQNLSIGFYNYYLNEYEKQLGKSFENQQPCNKYTMYKRLSNTKRKLNKKVQGFRTLEQDPIFSKYKERLSHAIKVKQTTLKQINQLKSKQMNEKYGQRLFKELNDKNCSNLIDQYCKSDLDDQKSDVLLNKFQKIFQDKLRYSKKKIPTTGQNWEQKIHRVQRQIQALESKSKVKSGSLQKAQYGFDEKRASIKKKKQIYNRLEKQYKQEMDKANPQLIKLQKQQQRLNQKIANDQTEVASLREASELQIKNSNRELQNKLKKQQLKLKELEDRLKSLRLRPKQVTKQPKPKQKGCCCLIF